MDSQVADLFLEFSSRKLGEMINTLDLCLKRLTDEQIWQKQGEHENAVGNIILHLSGNMRQWIMHGVGAQPDVRTRDAEFAATGGVGREELLALFGATVGEAQGVLAGVSPERLLERINPQHGEVSVLEAIYHVVEHVQYHGGQIILLTKQMAGTDLDLTIPRPR